MVNKNNINVSDNNLKSTESLKRVPDKVKDNKPSKELLDALKELDYMEKHPEEYKSFHRIKELMEDLNSDN